MGIQQEIEERARRAKQFASVAEVLAEEVFRVRRPSDRTKNSVAPELDNIDCDITTSQPSMTIIHKLDIDIAEEVHVSICEAFALVSRSFRAKAIDAMNFTK